MEKEKEEEEKRKKEEAKNMEKTLNLIKTEARTELDGQLGTIAIVCIVL